MACFLVISNRSIDGAWSAAFSNSGVWGTGCLTNVTRITVSTMKLINSAATLSLGNFVLDTNIERSVLAGLKCTEIPHLVKIRRKILTNRASIHQFYSEWPRNSVTFRKLSGEQNFLLCESVYLLQHVTTKAAKFISTSNQTFFDQDGAKDGCLKNVVEPQPGIEHSQHWQLEIKNPIKLLFGRVWEISIIVFELYLNFKTTFSPILPISSEMG